MADRNIQLKDDVGNNLLPKTNAELVEGLSTVATTGSYDDLNNKPSIPTKTSDITNDSGFITNAYHDPTKVSKGGDTMNTLTIENTRGQTDFLKFRDFEFADTVSFTTSGRGDATVTFRSDKSGTVAMIDELPTVDVTKAYVDQQLANKEDISNKVSLSSTNTNSQYPNAKSVWDECQNIREVASGKETGWVIDYKTQITGTEDSSTGNWTNVTAITGLDLVNVKIGDNIYVRDNATPDYWVSAKTSANILSLHVLNTKIDLSTYLNSSTTLFKLNGSSKSSSSNASFYAPTSSISTSTAKRYLLGSSSTSSVTTESTNSSCYMQSGYLYSNGQKVNGVSASSVSGSTLLSVSIDGSAYDLPYITVTDLRE